MSVSTIDRELPSIKVSGYALIEFSTRLNLALKRFERRFSSHSELAERDLETPASHFLFFRPDKEQ